MNFPSAVLYPRLRWDCRKKAEEEMMRAGAVVLIVEDEPLIRFDTLDALEDTGYTVLEASNADEALVLLRGRPDVEVVFTDVNMYGSMDGLQLARHVRETYPVIGVVVTSGMVRLHAQSLPSRTAFLPKPYSFDDLNAAIEKVRGPART